MWISVCHLLGNIGFVVSTDLVASGTVLSEKNIKLVFQIVSDFDFPS